MTSSPAPLDDLISAEGLPAAIRDVVCDIYRPLAQALANRFPPKSESVALIGLNGCQGSGKSTMAMFLQAILAAEFNLRVAVLSLDDFYLTKRQRSVLSEFVHPLLRTRGVPGTHDMALLRDTIEALQASASEAAIPIPVFDKGTDNRLERSSWRTFSGRPDLILLEGWCVGAKAQTEQQLVQPHNAWEVSNDPSGKWRRFVNEQLDHDYRRVFDALDWLIMLCPPRLSIVLEWRKQQEQRLRELRSDENGVGMSDTELKDFVSHYERLTASMLETLPHQANAVVHLRSDRSLDRLELH